MVLILEIVKKNWRGLRNKSSCWRNLKDKLEEEKIKKKLINGKLLFLLKHIFYQDNKCIMKNNLKDYKKKKVFILKK